jgi:hypothetical protein
LQRGFAVQKGAGAFNPASAIGGLSLVCSVYVGWFVLPSSVKRIGESYAEAAWMAFLRSAVEEEKAESAVH